MDVSTMATTTVRKGLEFEASIEIVTPQAAEGLADFYAPVIKPDEAFDLTALFVLNGRKLRHCREQVVEADLEHRTQVETLTRLQGERDALTSSLGNRLVRIRRVCLGLYDEKELVRLGLDGTVSNNAVAVYRQGQKTWRRLLQSNLELKPPELEIEPMDLGPFIEALGSDVKSLGTLLLEIGKQRRKVQVAAAVKGKALAEFERCYVLIGANTESAYRMADLDAEAARARPTRRRGGREVEDEEPAIVTGDESEIETAEASGDVTDV